MTWLSLSTAIIAVLAAIASLESGDHANEAIVLKTDATLTQSAADDAWGYYQAKSMKEDMYRALRTACPAAGSRRRVDDEGERGTPKRMSRRQRQSKLAAEVNAADAESRHHLELHHQFAKSVTIFQVAIALAAIAALARKKSLWWVSLAVGAIGAVFLARGFFPF